MLRILSRRARHIHWGGLTGQEKLHLLLASSGGVGLVAPFAPGTFGTVPAVGMVALLSLLPAWTLPLSALVVFFVGVAVANTASGVLGSKDPGPVTIDEIQGYLVSMIAVPVNLRTLGAAFVLFRFFDVVKPWPARQLEALPGGLGIMADDLFAGIYAAVGMQILIQTVPWFN